MFFKRSKPINPTFRTPTKNLDSRSKKFSYYKAQDYNSTIKNNLPRSIEKKRQFENGNNLWTKKVPIILFVCFIFIFGIYELILSSTPKINILGKESALQKRFMQPNYVYELAAQKLFKGSLSDRNKITINTLAIDNQMEKQFPELSNVSVILPILGHQPILDVSPAIPAIILQNQTTKFFLINNSGKVLSSNASTKDIGATLPLVIDQAGLDVSLGQTILSQNDIAFIQFIVLQLKSHNIPAQSLILPSASLELDVHLTGVSYFVKFNLDDNGNANQQIGTFLAIHKYLTEHNITPTQYIDVRNIGRVYYK